MVVGSKQGADLIISVRLVEVILGVSDGNSFFLSFFSLDGGVPLICEFIF